jgi:hypothetical protein
MEMDISPDVGLVEPREARDRRQADGPNPGHSERDETDIGVPLEEIEIEPGRNQGAEHRGIDRPVEK